MTFHQSTEDYVQRVSGTSVCEIGNQTWHGDSSEKFYRKIGYTRYLALDCNSRYGSHVCDLNEPVELDEQFDVVTNNGTGEHLFDQAAVFLTMHKLCKVGGHMIHVLPYHNWHNHGFYSFEPVLFRDLAAANHYEVVDIRLAHRDGESVPLELADFERTKWKGNGWTRGLSLVEKTERMSKLGTVMLACILKKTRDEAFKKPIQSIYDGKNYEVR